MPAILAATNLTTTSGTPATGIATLVKPQTDTITQFQISGTYGTVTFIFEGTTDSSTWFPVFAQLQSDGSPATGTIAPADNLKALYNIPSQGLSGIRLSVSAIASGTLTVSALSNANVGILSYQTNVISSYGAVTSTSITSSGLVKSSSPTAGVGYATGAGGAVTQITSRTTGVTLNTVTGAITLVSAAGSATPASFTVTNSAVAATDVVLVSQKSGTDLYEIFVTAVAAGSFRITSFTTGGTTSEQPVFNYTVIKGVAS